MINDTMSLLFYREHLREHLFDLNLDLGNEVERNQYQKRY